MYGGIQRPLSLTKHAFFVLCMYKGHTNIWGHTNILGVSKHMGASKHAGGVQRYSGHTDTPPKSDKACFLCVVYVQGAYKHMGAYKHIGGVQTYGGIKTCRGCTKV